MFSTLVQVTTYKEIYTEPVYLNRSGDLSKIHWCLFIMTIKDAYLDQYRKCLNKGLNVRSNGYYQTNIEFGGKNVYVSPDGSDVERNVFNVNGCKKTRVIKKDNKSVKKITFHKDKLPVTGTITKNNSFKKFIYKYVLFLRCDGVNESELIKLYVLQCIYSKFEFRRLKKSDSFKGWEVYTPEYEDISVMLDGIISSAIKKEIDDNTRSQFIVKTKCVINPTAKGNRKKTKKETLLDAHKGVGIATDNKISKMYDSEKTDEENAINIGVSVRRFREWKKNNVESPKDRIKRLYDPNKTLQENAKICGVSESSIKRYKRTLKVEEVVDKCEIENWIDELLFEDTVNDKPVRKEVVDDDLVELMDWVNKIEF